MEPTQNKKFDYVNAIIQFNTDPEIIALREKYSDPSFFEVISKERSETTYSAFLKWVFQDCAIGKGTISPILQLLNILVKRDQEQKEGRVEKIDDKLRNAILSGGVKIKTTKVDTELSIAEYLERLDEEGGNLQESPKEENGKSQNASQKDNRKKKLDIFIDCDVEINGSNYQRLQIIIENKIDSREGENQTICYYESTKRQQEDNILQLYVYLSPLASNKLTNLYQKKEEKLTTKKDSNEKLRCESKYFIHINYQDILDCIITPLLASNSISSRSRFFLEEFKNQLTYPNLESGELSIAIGQENIEQFTSLYSSYQQLIINSAIAYSEKAFKWVNGFIQEDKGKGAKKFNIEETACFVTFWEQNSKLLLAIMNGINANERMKIEKLIKIVSSRKKSTYKIYINGKTITKKTVTNAIAAKTIVQAWVDENTKNGNVLSLDNLRKAFPRDKNPYYDKLHSQLFKHLFYTYNVNNDYECDAANDAKPQKVPFRNMDIDFHREAENNYIIYLNGSNQKNNANNDQKVIMLKFWQKSGIEILIKYVIDSKNCLKGLKIEEVFNNRVIKTWSKSSN